MLTSRLETPDVNLYYTVRGSGPMLLILQGGAGNADGSDALAARLADRFTVVTYDRRGLSRSKPFPKEGYEIAAHAADAARLITALSSRPVFGFGASLGALIGLELAASYPHLVRMVIAHEPPAYRLLEGADQEEALRSHAALLETFRQEGVPAAMKLMFARSGVDLSDREPDVPAPVLPAPGSEVAARRFADLAHFLTWDAPAVSRFQPDIAAWKAAASRIVPAIGEGSPSTFPCRSTVALSAMLGRELVRFPGGHTGYILRPQGSAEKISELLQPENG